MRGAAQQDLLEVHDLVVRFGGLRALDGVSLVVPEQGIVGLIGPNGAGKTTLIDAVTGFAPIAGGSISFRGETVTSWSAHRRARSRLARTFQSLELFEDLTVAENVQVPTESGEWWTHTSGAFRGRDRSQDDVDRALRQLELDAVANVLPGELSMAQRKCLALARAMVVRPQLLLLDEPAAGLDRAGTEQLADRLRVLAREGTGLLLVDHDMALVLEVCAHVCVLDAGRVIATGTPAQIRIDQAVLRAYLGEDEPVSGTARS